MNKIQFIVKIIALFVVICGLIMCAPEKDKQTLDEEILALRRGKVSRSKKDNELNFESASILQHPDSTLISGTVIDDSNGKQYKMKPRKFPKWFLTGNHPDSSSVEYKIVGTDSARVKKFNRRGRVWQAPNNGKYWVCVLRKNGNSRGIKILIKNQEIIPTGYAGKCKKGKFVDYRLVDNGTRAKVSIR